MRFFRSEDALRMWQSEQQVAGEMLDVSQIWTLSQRWYSNRLTPEFRGRTVAQIEEIFRSLNLTSRFWYLDEA